ncbi:hypothetical protein OF829_02640 [Sphingomonas sp. LB-2]|uniref:hypothetical protein n=1 Tax=Sphingomonas caeni TaxID=2984949 RepID=UPI0022318BEE|nr:hypothetical protein [Sphingomonas caeni]MCW3846119.1 hypothetical protein [Sphingomonas caeni]
MTDFPTIDRPCPYAGRLDTVMDGDFCRACECTVFDLDAMAPRERRAFVKRTEGKDVCITYRIKPALAAAALLAALGGAAPAMAQDVDDDDAQIVVTGGRMRPPTLTASAEPVVVVTVAELTGSPNAVRTRPVRHPRPTDQRVRGRIARPR